MNPNRIALITGASSGIGRAFAWRFAQSGYDLIITGRRKDKLAQLEDELKENFGISVETIIAELSDNKDVNELMKIIKSHDNIFVLINNAGYGSGREFSQCDLKFHMQMLQVHVITSLKLIHSVLPQMISKKQGTIINVSSLGAFMPAPGSSIYSATKLFLKSFTESLYMEVSKYDIRVQCLCPGYTTHTEFLKRRMNGLVPKNSGFVPWMDADTLVDKCLKSLEKGKIVYVPGFMNRLLVKVVPFIPIRMYYNLMMKLSKKATENEPI